MEQIEQIEPGNSLPGLHVSSRRANWLCAALLIAAVCCGLAWAGPRASAAEPASVDSEPGLRSYYLSEYMFYPDLALTSCADGFHMASLWELFDTSNLSYFYLAGFSVPAGDGHEGSPPNYSIGWARTGYISSGENTAGTGNCQGWMSTSSSDYGTTLQLSSDWWLLPGSWIPLTATCDQYIRIWCVED